MASISLQKASEWVSEQITVYRPHTRLWATKGGLALLDEGMVAGSNFLIGILLARWLTADQYGAYALTYSIYLVLAALYQALILEPIPVFGPTFHPSNRKRYLGSLMKIQAMAILPIIALLGLSAYLADHTWAAQSFAWALKGVTVAAPFLLIFSFTRFAFYLDFKPGGALSGAVFYCVLIASGLVLLYRQELLSPFTAFLLMSVGALISSTVQLARLKPSVGGKFFDETLCDVWQKHWSYGRWSLPTSILVWLPINILYFLTGLFWGLAETGALKALANFIMPIGHLTAAFSLLLTPYVAKKYGEKGVLGANLQVRRINTFYLIIGISYYIAISVFSSLIFHALYGQHYSEFVYLVPWAAAAAALQMAGSGSRIGLRAIQSPSSLFVVYSVVGAVSVVVGIPLVWLYGVAGAIAGSVISGLVMFAGVVFLFHKKVSISTAIVS